ncbi:MAG TPA: O-antigen ligase family protein [Pyrinomonadaceae bacterium]|nr:O-antigen ligase family protein [Pyrinomonadaceae bacterium]
MTISASNVSPGARPRADAAPADGHPPPAPPAAPPSTAATLAPAAAPRTVWSSLVVLLLCTAVVTTTLAFGTVHSWSLGLFQLGAALVVVCWALDAWRSGTLRLSRNALQLPLVGLFAVGLVQLLPLGGEQAAGGLLAAEGTRALTLDPAATRVVLVQLGGLAVFFAAALAYLDSPERLRLVARLVIVFGFLLALYGLMQHFVNPATIFFLREPKQAAPFGPYVNRHHFAGYMEMTLALPLGLLFAGAVGRERALLYAFAAAVMAVALVATNSRGGIISMAAQIFFLVLVFPAARRREGEGGGRSSGRGARLRGAALRLALGFALVFGVLAGSIYFGGEASLSRLVGSVNIEDPTTGRAHFWRGAVEIFKDHPVLGAGLGAFPAAYTRYDTSNGSYRLEQAHNDYLQLLTDAGLVGGLLGLFFAASLVRRSLARMRSHDRFRRGVALGALTGCAGVLVHSLFDFTLHSTANALLFLVLAALATADGRVETPDQHHRRRRRRSGHGRERVAGAGTLGASRADAPAAVPAPGGDEEPAPV